MNNYGKAASQIIKAKLAEKGGRVTVYQLRGLPCEIYADTDGKHFHSDKLPKNVDWEYEIFDVITALLASKGGCARKGCGRNDKLGEGRCTEDTVVGAVAKYLGYEKGDSVLDPVFVLAAVLDWAGIAANRTGELSLN